MVYIDIPLTEDIRAAVAASWGYEGDSERLFGGEESAAYRVGEAVVRVGSRQRDPREMEWCHGIATAARAVPEVVAPLARADGTTLEMVAGRPVTLAVTGAAGAVGGYAVELAKADGLTVVADAAPRDIGRVREFGADHIVERGPQVAARIRRSAPGGVAGLVDGSMQTTEAVPAVADGGTIAEPRGWTGPAGRGIHVIPVMVTDGMTDTERLDALRRRAEDGILTLRVADVLPAEKAAEAHRLLEAGGLRGRLVLDFSEQRVRRRPIAEGRSDRAFHRAA
ncbi:zinc-binding dehydrogenase [Nocardia jinanensis]|uniref:Zinc-binding dehydrogenase n=1 Tax=Nocardia jinanensis TaxID=382504 RepID=A0A917VTS6_9NOCA|nr:zinc-binding dehydrogenase [Nocardia jinanensis]GGL17726.1 hypothetical protein GCM10011588_35580 [Nocardia jinanensis]